MPKIFDPAERRVGLASPREKLAFDGERVTPWVRSAIWAEHLHRYLGVTPYCPGRRVLDIACGEGYGSALLARSGAVSVVGADIATDIIKRASRIYQAENLSFQTASITEPLPFPDSSFDLISCFETIEHVGEQAEVIKELRRVLAPGGLLVISTPDKTHPNSSGAVNPYHVKELDEPEFRSLIDAEFSHVRTCYQRNLTGSMIVDETGSTGQPPEVWERDGFLEYVATDGPRLSRYVILWASDRPFDAPRTGVLHDGVLASLINQALNQPGADRLADIEPPELKASS